MTRSIMFLFCLLFVAPCYASDDSLRHEGGGDTRSLSDVFSNSDIILHGAVIGSGIGSCGGREGINSYYLIRVIEIIKGDIELEDIKACGAAPMLLASHYLIAGNKYSGSEIVFSPDAVLLVFPGNKYYRLISYDGPIVTSDRGEAYAVGLLQPDFAGFLGEINNKVHDMEDR